MEERRNEDAFIGVLRSSQGSIYEGEGLPEAVANITLKIKLSDISIFGK